MTERRVRARKKQQTVGKGLRGFKDARKVSNDLLRDIRTHVVAEGAKNAGVGREEHKIHVSELIKGECPRQLYYKLSHAERTDAPAPAFHQMEMIWAAGHSEHEKWQRWLWEMGDLWGSWYCKRCEGEFVALAPRSCEKCGYVGFLEYREVELEDVSLPLVGHADGAVPRADTLVEVKSFSIGTVRIEQPSLVKEHTHKVDGKTIVNIEGLWASIKRPFKSHLKQGMFYLWMCQRMGLPYAKILFIYENKTTQATKAFSVDYSERLITEHITELERVVTAATEGVVPERPRLFALDAKPCNSCPFRSGCWGTPEESNARTSTEDPAVPTRRSRSRSAASGGETEVRPSRASSRGDAESPRRHHRTGRPRPDRDDDTPDQVGRASRRATGDGGGGREVGGRSPGQGTGSRFSRSGSRRN